jgi:hypothetical protein
MPRRQRRPYGRRIEQRHCLGLAFVPAGHKAFGVFADLPLGRAACFCRSISDGLLLAFHLLAVEAHEGYRLAEADGVSIVVPVAPNNKEVDMSESANTPLPRDVTLRDWFAAQAMQQVINAIADPGSIAARAYKIGDAMLEPRPDIAASHAGKCHGARLAHPAVISGRMFRLYTNAFPARRLRKRVIIAMVLAGVALMLTALALAPEVPR